ncbi:hypothetical protein OB2597_04575 [Pseudooceanicola batsensis HTCC2597]|uniref:Gene transfer agent protein n=1 Tax=Pseudooceanicola batsensis (strain ATCC BAA-863 / DSM 15984 / KCTC 12145 / HTCC2597) TaxID=252305 RepID=A3U3P7_PSEBH|nr:head-tail connector protein [Pseudooceanicola batsensis]EAQ01249.1 hypothetical protein OB2597_04575 [Pseudooceanicola batsensis HTCC2597]
MLIEDTDVETAALPVEDFKAHLRLGRGFTGDTVQDAVLDSFLRAAMSAIEGRTGKVLMTRDFTWSFPTWRDDLRAVLPVGPVTALIEVALLDGDEAVTVVDPARYRLEKDLSFPALCGRSGGLPWPPADGRIRIRFTAGFGPAWSDLPADLAQAVMLLAAHYYEHREATGLGGGCMPFGVTSLIERYRPLRLLHGGRT